jgi:hypothetical protein
MAALGWRCFASRSEVVFHPDPDVHPTLTEIGSVRHSVENLDANRHFHRLRVIMPGM